MSTLRERARPVVNVRPARALDALALLPALDRTRGAHELRRRLGRWQEPPAGALTGRTALVTSATSALGLSIAAGLALAGARIVLADRGGPALDAAAATVAAATGSPSVSVVALDPGTGARDLARASSAFVSDIGHLDVAVLLDGRDADGAPSPADLPFALTARLQPAFAPGARVIWVATQGDRATGELAREWARRLAPVGVSVHAVNPGWVDPHDAAPATPDRPGRRRFGPPTRSPGQAADTVTWLATDEGAGRVAGGYWLDRQRRPMRTWCLGHGRARGAEGNGMSATATRTGTSALVPPLP